MTSFDGRIIKPFDRGESGSSEKGREVLRDPWQARGRTLGWSWGVKKASGGALSSGPASGDFLLMAGLGKHRGSPFLWLCRRGDVVLWENRKIHLLIG